MGSDDMKPFPLRHSRVHPLVIPAYAGIHGPEHGKARGSPACAEDDGIAARSEWGQMNISWLMLI